MCLFGGDVLVDYGHPEGIYPKVPIPTLHCSLSSPPCPSAGLPEGNPEVLVAPEETVEVKTNAMQEMSKATEGERGEKPRAAARG